MMGIVYNCAKMRVNTQQCSAQCQMWSNSINNVENSSTALASADMSGQTAERIRDYVNTVYHTCDFLLTVILNNLSSGYEDLYSSFVDIDSNNRAIIDTDELQSISGKIDTEADSLLAAADSMKSIVNSVSDISKQRYGGGTRIHDAVEDAKKYLSNINEKMVSADSTGKANVATVNQLIENLSQLINGRKGKSISDFDVTAFLSSTEYAVLYDACQKNLTLAESLSKNREHTEQNIANIEEQYAQDAEKAEAWKFGIAIVGTIAACVIPGGVFVTAAIALVEGCVDNAIDQWAAGTGIGDEGFDYSSMMKDGLTQGLTALVTGGIGKAGSALSGMSGAVTMGEKLAEKTLIKAGEKLASKGAEILISNTMDLAFGDVTIDEYKQNVKKEFDDNFDAPHVVSTIGTSFFDVLWDDALSDRRAKQKERWENEYGIGDPNRVMNRNKGEVVKQVLGNAAVTTTGKVLSKAEGDLTTALLSAVSGDEDAMAEYVHKWKDGTYLKEYGQQTVTVFAGSSASEYIEIKEWSREFEKTEAARLKYEENNDIITDQDMEDIAEKLKLGQELTPDEEAVVNRWRETERIIGKLKRSNGGRIEEQLTVEEESDIRRWAAERVRERDSRLDASDWEPYNESYNEYLLSSTGYTIDELADGELNPLVREREGVETRIEIGQKVSKKYIDKGINYLFRPREETNSEDVTKQYRYTTDRLFDSDFQMQKPISNVT